MLVAGRFRVDLDDVVVGKVARIHDVHIVDVLREDQEVRARRRRELDRAARTSQVMSLKGLELGESLLAANVPDDNGAILARSRKTGRTPR